MNEGNNPVPHHATPAAPELFMHCPLFETLYYALFYTTTDPVIPRAPIPSPVEGRNHLFVTHRVLINAAYLCAPKVRRLLGLWHGKADYASRTFHYTHAMTTWESPDTALRPYSHPDVRALGTPPGPLTPAGGGDDPWVASEQEQNWWRVGRSCFLFYINMLTQRRARHQWICNTLWAHHDAQGRTYRPEPPPPGGPLSEDAAFRALFQRYPSIHPTDRIRLVNEPSPMSCIRWRDIEERLEWYV